jgi:CheY-like chemotaxis protein
LVLVVDDDDDQRAMYAMVLEAAGYRVVESAHGTNAIAKAIGLRPDLILLDFSVPGLARSLCAWAEMDVRPDGHSGDERQSDHDDDGPCGRTGRT